MNDAAYLKYSFDHRPTKRHTRPIPEYAETTVIPTGKYRGMLYRNYRAPYMTEPLFLMSPHSPIQEIRCMFPAQTGKSTIGELVTMYYITEHPSEILYVSSNETAAIRWMQRRIEPRAHAAGIIFRSQADSKATRRTGDTSYSKEFDGGNVDVASSQSAQQLASETKRIVIADETDRWKRRLGEEGLTWDIMYARTQAWSDERKIIAISTPTTKDMSAIFGLYQEGDQREYWVFCPYCGHAQLLDFSHGRTFGLKWEYKDGKIARKSVVYICESSTCGKEIVETKKPQMLIHGEWRKSAIPINEYIASFHINGIYSPFLKWYDMALAYDDAQKDPEKMQTLWNLKMGLPYEESGSRPKAEKIIENRGTYRSGTIPDGVLYLTAGVDVQEGSDNNDNNPPRIEMEVLGTGIKHQTWSICYEVFKGPIWDIDGGAWAKFREWVDETKLRFYRNDGMEFPIEKVFVDSGSGKVTSIVYRFCDLWDSFYPSKGMSDIRTGKKDHEMDIIMQGNKIPYRRSLQDDGTILYLVNTNYYKSIVYYSLNAKKKDGEIEKGDYCTFPSNYTDWYFQMLTAEIRHRDGTFHNPGGRRNEALDCRCLALCAADVDLNEKVRMFKDRGKELKYTEAQILQINKPWILQKMIEQTARRKIANG